LPIILNISAYGLRCHPERDPPPLTRDSQEEVVYEPFDDGWPGFADELYQGLLPNRYFTWYDIGLNAMGGIVTYPIVFNSIGSVLKSAPYGPMRNR